MGKARGRQWQNSWPNDQGFAAETRLWLHFRGRTFVVGSALHARDPPVMLSSFRQMGLLLWSLNSNISPLFTWARNSYLLKFRLFGYFLGYFFPLSPLITTWTLIAKIKNNQWVKNIPCSLWLTGRVHEEECDGSFSVNRFKTRNCVRFYEKENGKKEMTERKIVTFSKGFGEGDLESLKIILLFVIMKQILAHYLTTQLFILLLKY